MSSQHTILVENMKNLKSQEYLYNVICSKAEELKDQFDLWLIRQNIHEIKGIKGLLSLCNEGGDLLQKHITIQKPNQKYNEISKGSINNYGYTVTSTVPFFDNNDIFLLIPKKLAEKLVSLESFKI